MPTPSQSERTLQMKRSYVRLHNSGLSPKNIAHMFDLCTASVYEHLQEIADDAGVSRESLLDIPRSKHITHERRFEPVAPINLAEVRERSEKVICDLTALNKTISEQIQAEEANAVKFEKEEASWQI